MKPNIEIEIQELILRGFSRQDAYLIRKAIEVQLTQYFQAGGMSANLPTEINIEQLKVNPIYLKTGYQAPSVGFEVADSIFKGLTQIQNPVNQ